MAVWICSTVALAPAASVLTVKPATFTPARVPANSKMNPAMRLPVTVTLPAPIPVRLSSPAFRFARMALSVSSAPRATFAVAAP